MVASWEVLYFCFWHLVALLLIVIKPISTGIREGSEVNNEGCFFSFDRRTPNITKFVCRDISKERCISPLINTGTNLRNIQPRGCFLYLGVLLHCFRLSV